MKIILRHPGQKSFHIKFFLGYQLSHALIRRKKERWLTIVKSVLCIVRTLVAQDSFGIKCLVTIIMANSNLQCFSTLMHIYRTSNCYNMFKHWDGEEDSQKLLGCSIISCEAPVGFFSLFFFFYEYFKFFYKYLNFFFFIICKCWINICMVSML